MEVKSTPQCPDKWTGFWVAKLEKLLLHNYVNWKPRKHDPQQPQDCLNVVITPKFDPWKI